MDIEQLRREYERAGLSEDEVADDPLRQFRIWFDEACRSGIYLPDSVVLATTDRGGAPDARVVALRGVDERGFRFYTSYESAKAADLESNPQAAMVFLWSDLERQVRVRGRVERLPRAESERYFRSRPRPSQIGAWASPQSRILEGRSALEARFAEFERQFEGAPIPAPPHWGGYLLAPVVIEFWQGRPGRLHDRLRFSRPGGGARWAIERLAP